MEAGSSVAHGSLTMILLCECWNSTADALYGNRNLKSRPLVAWLEGYADALYDVCERVGLHPDREWITAETLDNREETPHTIVLGENLNASDRSTGSRNWLIVAKSLIGVELHPLDADVAGEYHYSASDADAALDEFHSTVPIKVLDDFDICAKEVTA